MTETLRNKIAMIVHDTLCRYCDDGAGAGIDVQDAEKTADAILVEFRAGSDGVALFALERDRQITRGFTPEHDDQHVRNELVNAAVYYLKGPSITAWPVNWGPARERGTRIRNLERAGALLAAEVDRLHRAAGTEPIPAWPSI